MCIILTSIISFNGHNLTDDKDYTPPPYFTINATNTTAQLFITIKEDDEFEGIETFNVFIEDGPIYTPVNPRSATVVIMDDESKYIPYLLYPCSTLCINAHTESFNIR